MVGLITEVDAGGLTARQFHDEHARAGQPVVLRGAVSDWPAVRAGRESPEALASYLLQFDRGQPARAMVAPAAAGGRFFYNEALTDFNFQSQSVGLASALDVLLDNGDEPHPTALLLCFRLASSRAPGSAIEW